MKKLPGSFKVDPECPLVEAGWLWHVTTKDEDALSDVRQRAQNIAATGQLHPEYANHADLVAGVASTIDSAVTVGTVIQLPDGKEEPPGPTEEAQRKAEEAAAAKLIKHKKPKPMIPSRRAKSG